MLLNLSNKYIYILNAIKGAIAAINQGKQLLAVEVAIIRHLRPIITKTYNKVIKYKIINFKERAHLVRRLRDI
jgi:hypothetical protein